MSALASWLVSLLLFVYFARSLLHPSAVGRRPRAKILPRNENKKQNAHTHSGFGLTRRHALARAPTRTRRFINARRRIVQPMIDQSNRSSGNLMAGPAYSPDATGMGYMLDAGSQPFRALPGVDAGVSMNPSALSHAAMTSAMGAYTAASAAQHQLSQYNRSQQQQAAMLGLSGAPASAHMMGAHPALQPPHSDAYY